jgi:acetyl/propionyl-CoA carboxylase alpha subunit
MEEGLEIPIYYDPMIAKLITHGKDREEAIQRMVRAIDDYQISGCETTLPFCKWAIQHEAFVSGNFDTHFVKKYFTPEVLDQFEPNEEKVAAIAALRHLLLQTESSENGISIPDQSNWSKNRRFA